MIYGETRRCRRSGPTDSDAQATGKQGDRSPRRRGEDRLF